MHYKIQWDIFHLLRPMHQVFELMDQKRRTVTNEVNDCRSFRRLEQSKEDICYTHEHTRKYNAQSRSKSTELSHAPLGWEGLPAL